MNQARQEGELFCSPPYVGPGCSHQSPPSLVPTLQSITPLVLNQGAWSLRWQMQTSPLQSKRGAWPPQIGAWCWAEASPVCISCLACALRCERLQRGSWACKGARLWERGCHQALLFVCGGVTQCWFKEQKDGFSVLFSALIIIQDAWFPGRLPALHCTACDG